MSLFSCDACDLRAAAFFFQSHTAIILTVSVLSEYNQSIPEIITEHFQIL